MENELFKVYDCHKKVIPGQGGVDVEWVYLCKDQTGRFVTVWECKSWGYCSPCFDLLKKDILSGKYVGFYCGKPKEADLSDWQVPDQPVAEVASPITSELVLQGISKFL